MKILILTLTGQRDKAVDKLIAKHLEDRGHEVYVHNYIMAGRKSVPYLKPDVVVHPMVGGQFKFDFAKQCKEWGCEIVVRRGEAGASRRSFDLMDPERQSIVIGNWDYEPYVDLELTWGTEFTELLAEKGRMPRAKMQPCGAFAFDPYYQPDFQRDRNHRKTVLFATGFSTADSRVEYCECGLDKDSPYHEVIYETHRKARDNWIDAIRRLHAIYGNEWRFTLKVRPGEQTSEYIEKLRDIVGVYAQVQPAHAALQETDFVVHSGSTLAMEAHLLNIPTVNFCNVNPDSIFANLAPRAETFEELVSYFRDSIDVDKTNINWSVLRELEAHLYGQIDGKACWRAAEAIHNHIMPGGNPLPIKTDIPDEWPKDPIYYEKGTGVHLKKRKDDQRWLCPCCQNVYWAANKLELTTCPYCGMGIGLVKNGAGVQPLNPNSAKVNIQTTTVAK